MFFAEISASIFSDSGAFARPVGEMLSPSQPARAIAAAIAADASSARAKGRFKLVLPEAAGPSVPNGYPEDVASARRSPLSLLTANLWYPKVNCQAVNLHYGPS